MFWGIFNSGGRRRKPNTDNTKLYGTRRYISPTSKYAIVEPDETICIVDKDYIKLMEEHLVFSSILRQPNTMIYIYRMR